MFICLPTLCSCSCLIVSPLVTFVVALLVAVTRSRWRPVLRVLPDNRRVMNRGESWKSSLTDGEAISTSAVTRGGAGRDTQERPS